MEKWSWPKQLDLWPRPMSPEELEEANDELRRAGNYDKRKGRDGSKEETTKAVEKEGVKPSRILSPKESVKEAGKVVAELEKAEKEKGGKSEYKKKE